jgi:ABC-type iron transport system FetAB permease component
VVHVVLVGHSIYHYCLRFDKGVVHVVLVGYIVYHYCFRFDQGVVHFVLVILSTITA